MADNRQKNNLLAITQHWNALTARDQMALAILGVFLLLFIGGYGGFELHQAADKQKTKYQEQIADYFWLRAQAGNIDVAQAQTNADEQNEPIEQMVNRILTQNNAKDLVVSKAGEQAQFSFSQTSQAQVGRIINELAQAGLEFIKLNISQNPDTNILRVQATVGR